jgi:hypothetical protein
VHSHYRRLLLGDDCLHCLRLSLAFVGLGHNQEAAGRRRDRVEGRQETEEQKREGLT